MTRISSLVSEKSWIGKEEKDSFCLTGYHPPVTKKQRIHILAMGDVGGTLALALKLLGPDIVESIGICDLNENICQRYEAELNQISMPEDYFHFPPVEIITSVELFRCDVLLFVATKGAPPVGSGAKDMRMVQLAGNLELVGGFAKKAVSENFQGDFFVISDPVDPLCQRVVESGVNRSKVKGFGLGVMNARAAYFAKQDDSLKQYLTEGRAFGPHGADLVIADSIENYNEEASAVLTKKTVEANLRIRDMGFKPYIAPAVSSGAISVLEDLRGHWHYSSACFGNAFLGMHCKRGADGLEIENLELADALFERIEKAYRNLEEIAEKAEQEATK